MRSPGVWMFNCVLNCHCHRKPAPPLTAKTSWWQRKMKILKLWISWAKYRNWHFSIWSCRYFLAVSQCASGLICSRYPSPWHPIYQEIWACQIPSRLRHFSIFIALFAPTRPNVQKVRTPCCVDIRRAFYGRLGDIRSWTYDKCQNQILDIFYTSSSTPFPKRRLSISLFGGWWSDGKERREESDKSQFWNFNERKKGRKTPKQSDSALTHTAEKQKNIL